MSGLAPLGHLAPAIRAFHAILLHGEIYRATGCEGIRDAGEEGELVNLIVG